MLNDNHKMILGTTEILIILFTTYLLNIVKILPLLQSRIYVIIDLILPHIYYSKFKLHTELYSKELVSFLWLVLFILKLKPTYNTKALEKIILTLLDRSGLLVQYSSEYNKRFMLDDLSWSVADHFFQIRINNFCHNNYILQVFTFNIENINCYNVIYIVSTHT